MQQHELLAKRNLIITSTYLLTVILYIVAIATQVFNFTNFKIIISLITIFILALLYLLKLSPTIIQIAVIFCWHILVFTINMDSLTFFSLYTYIYLIVILALYGSKIINTINILFTVIEVSIIFQYSTIPFSKISNQGSAIFIFFLVVVCLMSLFQTVYIKYIWEKAEKRSLDREYNLSSKEAYLRLFFEQAEDAIAVFDMDDCVIAVNPAFEKLYGWTKEEAIGRSLPLVPPENLDDAKKRAEKLRLGQSYHLFETKDMKKDGTIFDVQISLSPILNPHGEIIGSSVISRDISYIKENESLILQSEKLKLVGELAAGVAHEIRNPMTVISGFMQMMNEDPQSPYYDYTKLIQNEIERIDLILEEFLVLSRPQLHQMIPINLINSFEEVKQLFQLQFQQKSIEFKIDPRYSDTRILGNANQIKQVFINLIKNAIEAIGENGEISIKLCKGEDDKQIFISLKDTGCGIPPNVLDRIFEPFYTTKTKGTGLGMMIIKKVVEDHQGTIKIHSKLNVGTEILLSFSIET